MIIRHDRQSIIRHVLRLTLGEYAQSRTIRYNTTQNIKSVDRPTTGPIPTVTPGDGRDRLLRSECAEQVRDSSAFYLRTGLALSGDNDRSLGEVGQGDVETTMRESEAGPSRDVVDHCNNTVEGQELWTGLIDHLKSNQGFSHAEEDQWFKSCTQIILSTTFQPHSSSSYLQHILALPANHPGRLIIPTKTYLSFLRPITSETTISSLEIRLLQLRLLTLHHQSPSLPSTFSSNINPKNTVDSSFHLSNIPTSSHPIDPYPSPSYSYFRKTSKTHIGVIRELSVHLLNTLHQLWNRDGEVLKEMGVGSKWFDLVLLVQSMQYRRIQNVDWVDAEPGAPRQAEGERVRISGKGNVLDGRYKMWKNDPSPTNSLGEPNPSDTTADKGRPPLLTANPSPPFATLDAIEILSFIRSILGPFCLSDKPRILRYMRGYLDLGDMVFGLDMTERDWVDWHTWREWVKRGVTEEAVLEIWRRRRGVLNVLGLCGRLEGDGVEKGNEGFVDRDLQSREEMPEDLADARAKLGGDTGESRAYEDWKTAKSNGVGARMRLGDMDGHANHDIATRLEITQMILDVMQEEDKYGCGERGFIAASELGWWRSIKDVYVRDLWSGLEGYFSRIKVLESEEMRFKRAVRPDGNESWMIRLLARECLLPDRLRSDMSTQVKNDAGIEFDTRDPVGYLSLLLGFHSGSARSDRDDTDPRWIEHFTATIHLVRNGLYNTHRFDDILRMARLLQRESTTSRPGINAAFTQISPNLVISSTIRAKMTPKPARSNAVSLKTRPPRFDILQSLYTTSPSMIDRQLPSNLPTQSYSNDHYHTTLQTLAPPPLPGSVHSHLLTTPRTPAQFAQILPLLAGMNDATGNTSMEKPIRRVLRYYADQLGDEAIARRGGRGMMEDIGDLREGESYKDLLERCFERWGVGFSDSVLAKIKDAERMESELYRDGLQSHDGMLPESGLGQGEENCAGAEEQEPGWEKKRQELEDLKSNYKIGYRTPKTLSQVGKSGRYENRA